MSLLLRSAGLAFAAALTVLSASLSAQEPNSLEKKEMFRNAKSIMAGTSSSAFKKLMKDKNESIRYNALRVASDLAAKDMKSIGNGVYYVVPPLSNIQRLPNQFPVDGKLGAYLDIVMAQNEYEPGSFVVYVDSNKENIQLKASDLKSGNSVIPAADVDLKVIKVWYQNGNAWYNYFGDFSHKLVPELLLNDENLIKVDTEKQENYVRADYENGSRYIWISAPEQIDPKFDTHQEPVYDAKTIQPVKFNAGEFKQFFVTVKTSGATKPGLYEGQIAVGNLFNIPVRVRVLPFELPEPKTYYDRSADFYTMLYCVPGMDQYYAANGKDKDLSDRKALNRLINQRNHNITSPLYMGMWRGYENFDDVKNSIGLAKKANMKMDPFFEAFGCHASFNMRDFLKNKRHAELAKKELGALLGHTNLWPAGGEEPGYSRIVNARKDWKTVHDLGLHVMCNGGDRRNFSGYNDDFRVGGGFASADEADFMHRIKGRIGNYAGPHTGPENPDYMRRHHGMFIYKKDYDMMYNYGYHEGGWNDFHTDTYRNFNLVQYTKDSVIDTLAWEGIREGIDDIRYATYMLQLADIAAKSAHVETVYAGRKALQFMALWNENEDDLNAMRMEMIRQILALREYLGLAQKDNGEVK